MTLRKRDLEHEKQQQREYHQRPEVKKHRRKYQQKYMKEYCQRPEVKERTREHRRKYQQQPENKEKMKIQHTIRSLQQKAKLVEYKGGKCENCGLITNTKNQCVFELHHLNPTEKEFKTFSTYRRWNIIKKEADKCIMLCANCHRIIHNT